MLVGKSAIAPAPLVLLAVNLLTDLGAIAAAGASNVKFVAVEMVLVLKPDCALLSILVAPRVSPFLVLQTRTVLARCHVLGATTTRLGETRFKLHPISFSSLRSVGAVS